VYLKQDYKTEDYPSESLKRLEPYEVHSLSFNQTLIYYEKAIKNIDPSVYHLFRTPIYWELHDRYFIRLTQRYERMKLFLFYYVSFIKNRTIDEEYQLLITPDERVSEQKAISFNINF